ncbi:unnamed protein product [Symbiodinium natans]|uniref:Uncharacterized protein n=1 Tax=Symbiodinium natans TaxID=878477 RepID=A0A812S1D3_9DINO|nr:unnamed protein product [Symbiodinium natans]
MAARSQGATAQMNYAAGSTAGSTFREVASNLANELVAQLTQEHTREVTAMYQEVIALRNELQRVAELMQGYMQREKQLHEMMEQLTSTYQEATAHFHVAHSNFNDHATTAAASHDQQRRALADPMRDTELELQRINALLAQPPIPPPDLPSHLHQGCRSAPPPRSAVAPVSTGFRGQPMQPVGCRSNMQLNV